MRVNNEIVKKFAYFFNCNYPFRPIGDIKPFKLILPPFQQIATPFYLFISLPLTKDQTLDIMTNRLGDMGYPHL